jgi:anti-anti-sigma factor
MDLTHFKEDDITVIKIEGKLDAATAPVADKTVKEILEADCNRVLFDFSKLDYLSSGGLRVVLGAAKELKRRQGKLALCSLSSYVREIFDVSGFSTMIPIADTFESGIEQLK